jgi:hypothetical protein
MTDNYTFTAVASPGDVTSLLTSQKASKARVAGVGQEDPAKRFNVWYVPTDHQRNWHFMEIEFDKNSDKDTDAVTTEINKSDLAAVTFLGQFLGQGPKYYVWWRD